MEERLGHGHQRETVRLPLCVGAGFFQSYVGVTRGDTTSGPKSPSKVVIRLPGPNFQLSGQGTDPAVWAVTPLTPVTSTLRKPHVILAWVHTHTHSCAAHST